MFEKEILDYELQQIPSLNNSTIEKYYPELEQNWEEGIQLADNDYNPYSRTFSFLSFDLNSDSEVIKVDVSEEREEYDDKNFYYIVRNFVYEDNYSSCSAVSNSGEEFLRWKKVKSKLIQESLWTHKKVHSLNWNLPQGSAIQNTLYINAGRYISAQIITLNKIKVILKNNKEDEGYEINNISNFILKTKLIEIQVTPNLNSNNYIEVNFYGQLKWSSVLPGEEISESILIHPINTSLEDRLKPPGMGHINDNFWNNKNYPQRFSKNLSLGEASWI